MKKSPPESKTIGTEQEAQTLLRKINAAKKRCSKLRIAVEENPTAENQKRLTRLEQSIEQDSDKLHLYTIAAAEPVAISLIETLPDIIERQSDEELLELGDKAFAVEMLESIRFFRNQFFDSTMLLSNNEIVKAFLQRFEDAVTNGEAKLLEKRRKAAERFPELARKFRPPDFEMPAEYNELVNVIMGYVEKREQIIKDRNLVHPNKVKEWQVNLAEMDRIINKAEQKLAEMYERHQKKQRYLDGLRKLVASGSNTERFQMRQYIKENPGKEPALEIVMEKYFPEEADE